MKTQGLLALGLLAGLFGCRDADSVVLVNVSINPDGPAVFSLRVALSTQQTRDSKVYAAKPSGTALSYPASFAIIVPRSRIGDLDLAIDGIGSDDRTIANGTARTTIVVGGTATVSVTLSAGPSLCGNEVVDPGETCDDGNRYSFDACDFRCRWETVPVDASVPVDAGFFDSANPAEKSDASVPETSWSDTAKVDTGTPDGSAPETAMPDIIAATDSGIDPAKDSSLPLPDVPNTVDAEADVSEPGTGGIAGMGGAIATGGTGASGGITGSGGNMGTGGSSYGGSIGAGGATGTGGAMVTPGPSCAGLPATCGPSGNESCCTGLLVPGGSFFRSYDAVDFVDDGFPATVASFYLDKYEITVGRFRAFVDAGKGTQKGSPAPGAGRHPLIAGSGWDATWNVNLPADTADLKSIVRCESAGTWTDSAGQNDSRPINCIDWYVAFAFCAWDGGRLPTEAEWNYAAAGGSQQRYFPWSSPPNSTIIDDEYAVFCGGACSSTQNVGARSPMGDGFWGHSDLAGNVWEWTLDSYATPYSPSTCDNCASLAPASQRVVRGGSYFGVAANLRVSVRSPYDPLSLHASFGARCARPSPP